MSGESPYLDKTRQRKLAVLRALIVDDQPEIRTIIREVLEQVGAPRPFEAADGKAAFECLDGGFGIVNFIICDWNMPGMNGMDFLKRVRITYPAMPFLMITGRSGATSVLEARRAGVSAYIRKPFSPVQLEEKILALIQSWD